MEKKLQVNPRAKALIFDLDGTLADTMPVHYRAYQHILKDYGIDFSPELFASLAGIPAVGTIAKLNEIFGTSMDAEKVGQYKEEEYEKIMYKMKPIEPVINLLKENYGKLPLAIGTGGYRRLAWKTLQILELDEYVDILVSADDITHPKPHPETFLRCAELMGAPARDCQVFEDGQPGMQAAKAAGMMATLVTDFYNVSIGEEI